MIGAKIGGVPETKAALAGIVPKLRVRALANALRGGAREVQKTARAATPVISDDAPAVRKGYRKPGTVQKAISVRTSKIARRKGDVGVFVNVRPLPGAKYKTVKRVFGLKKRVLVKASQRSAKNPNDPFYWRFLEFGQRSQDAAEFLQKGSKRLPYALQVFNAKILPAIAKLNRPKAPAP